MSSVIPQQRPSWSEIPISRAGLGLSRIGSVASPITANEAKRLIELAYDHGLNFFDTADVYGQGDSERLLGAALKTKRAQIVISTKAGFILSTKARIASYAKPVLSPMLRLVRKSAAAAANTQDSTSRPAMEQNFSREHIRRSIEGSLRRLRTDYIDLFMLHSPPVSGLNLNELMEALQSAKQSGKIRAIGVSSRSMEDLSIWSKWPIVDAIQVRLNNGGSLPLPHPNDTTTREISIIARQVLSGSGTGLDQGKSPSDAIRSALRVANFVLFGTTNVAHLRANIAAFAIA